MPSAVRRLACIALASAALLCPAVAHADLSGGAAAPPVTTADGGESSGPTGGAVPTKPSETPKKKKKKKKKKPRKPPKPPADGPGAADIPSDYLRLYHDAASAQHVSWRLL